MAARLGLTEDQTWSRLRRAGINRGRTPQSVTDQKVGELYEAGLSIRAIAAELGIHYRNVWRHLHRAGVERWPRGTGGIVLSRRALERLYLDERLSLAEVARQFEVSPDVVARNLRRYGIARHRPPLERGELEELYVHQRLGLRAVAARLGVSEGQVRSGLARHGIAVRQPGRPGTG